MWKSFKIFLLTRNGNATTFCTKMNCDINININECPIVSIWVQVIWNKNEH